MWISPLLQQISLIDNGVLEKIEETPEMVPRNLDNAQNPSKNTLTPRIPYGIF